MGIAVKIACLVLIFLVESTKLSAAASTCFDAAIPRGKSSSSVKLPTQIKAPYFYFRSFDYNFAILASSDDVHGALQLASANGSKDAGELLRLVSKDLPLERNTDLFKYVLSDSYQLSAIQRVLVGLLGSGKAAVFDAETGHLSSTMEIKFENSEHLRGRTFYDSNKEILVQSVDCVVD